MAGERTVEERLERLEAGQVALREEMEAGFARMATREEMEAGFARMATREELERLREESIAVNVELREYIEFVSGRHAAETRHYFDIVAEGLRDAIKRVAEVQVVANEKLDATNDRIDRVEQKMDAGFASVRRDIAALTRAFQGSRPARRR